MFSNKELGSASSSNSPAHSATLGRSLYSRPLKSIGKISSNSSGFLQENKFGSLHSITGTNSLLDPMQLMSMQNDAHSRKITSEIMRRSLHNSVATPSRRRYNKGRKMTSSLYSGKTSPRFFQSLPVTPACPSPKGSPSRRISGYFCEIRGPNMINSAEEEGSKGLVSLFSPKPRLLAAAVGSRTALCGVGVEGEDDDLSNF